MTREEWEDQYFKLYNELVEIVNPIKQYYDVDKIKTWGIFIYDKNTDANCFDILKDEIVFYYDHEIINNANHIILDIQNKLIEMYEFGRKIKS